jgi:hypothetical protein
MFWIFDAILDIRKRGVDEAPRMHAIHFHTPNMEAKNRFYNKAAGG